MNPIFGTTGADLTAPANCKEAEKTDPVSGTKEVVVSGLHQSAEEAGAGGSQFTETQEGV